METVKRGRGRPEGAVSTVLVRLGDLKAYFNSDEMMIPVGKKFLDSLGLTGKLASPTVENDKVNESPKVEIEYLDFTKK